MAKKKAAQVEPKETYSNDWWEWLESQPSFILSDLLYKMYREQQTDKEKLAMTEKYLKAHQDWIAYKNRTNN